MLLNPVSIHEAARYMGVRGEPPCDVAELLKRAEKSVREQISPRYVYREAALLEKDGGLFIQGIEPPLVGEDIKAHLDGCTKVIVLAATLTTAADKLIRSAEAYNVAEALALDCVCSAAIEQVCDRAEDEIFSCIEAPFRTWRFSPGYGDFPLNMQKDILWFLNAHRRIGLTVTENSLLIPSKSVTAVIGVSERAVQRKAIKCENCSMNKSCAFRAEGGCGK